MPAAIAPIGPLAQESPYIVGVALKRPKKKKKRKKKKKKKNYFLKRSIYPFSLFWTIDFSSLLIVCFS